LRFGVEHSDPIRNPRRLNTMTLWHQTGDAPCRVRFGDGAWWLDLDIGTWPIEAGQSVSIEAIVSDAKERGRPTSSVTPSGGIIGWKPLLECQARALQGRQEYRVFGAKGRSAAGKALHATFSMSRRSTPRCNEMARGDHKYFCALIRCAACGLIAATTWAGPETGEKVTSPLSQWLAGDGMTGNWDGMRSALVAEHGVKIFGSYMAEVWGNTVGGLKQGALYTGLLGFGADVDLEKLIGWKGASIHNNWFW
jgi:hypothetical protein